MHCATAGAGRATPWRSLNAQDHGPSPAEVATGYIFFDVATSKKM
jgi:hypothetical protein